MGWARNRKIPALGINSRQDTEQAATTTWTAARSQLPPQLFDLLTNGGMGGQG